MAVRRMAREERRRQLLDTAYEVIRREGTDALTLVSLAERAGVSRPVVYEHFGTREGLLAALYRDYDEQLLAALAAAAGGRSLRAVATGVAQAYLDGAVAAGPECDEVAAALAGSAASREVLRRSRDAYVEELRAAFAPFADLDGERGDALLVGALGALAGLGRAAAAGQVSPSAAVAAGAAVLAGALRRGAG